MCIRDSHMIHTSFCSFFLICSLLIYHRLWRETLIYASVLSIIVLLFHLFSQNLRCIFRKADFSFFKQVFLIHVHQEYRPDHIPRTQDRTDHLQMCIRDSSQGSFPFFLIGINGLCRLYAIGTPKINPLDSGPTTTSNSTSFNFSCIRSIARCNPCLLYTSWMRSEESIP